MAIAVLVLWLFTAGAGFYLLVTSNLGRARPAVNAPAASASAANTRPATAPAATAPAAHVRAATAPSAALAEPATASVAATAAPAVPVGPAAPPTPAVPAAPGSQAPSAAPASKREIRRAVRDRFDPPSLTAAKSAPVVPGLRSLLEFAHPASAIVGLGFWLAFTLVHNRVLGWIGFGLVTATVCLGLTWFTASTRAARRQSSADGEPAPSFSTRMLILHGSAAAVTFVLAALAAVVLGQ
jgi:hypothetical protein